MRVGREINGERERERGARVREIKVRASGVRERWMREEQERERWMRERERE